jgi:ABC-type phosphate transport system permease subunit
MPIQISMAMRAMIISIIVGIARIISEFSIFIKNLFIINRFFLSFIELSSQL